MDLNTVVEICDGRTFDDWQPGDAWLAGGTYLFSEPQPQVRRLIDLGAMGWPPLVVTADGLEISATCTIAELVALAVPDGWPAAGELFEQCARALLASFKIWNVATVGGNLCNSLPAGSMISLTAALDGVCTILTPDGGGRRVSVADFVTGNGTNVLLPGELLRSVFVPSATLRARTAFRQGSLYRHGRSAALVIGRRDPNAAFTLTITASTPRPVQLSFPELPSASELTSAIEQRLPSTAYFDDVHGDPRWREHLTLRFAEEIRRELADPGDR